MRDFLGREINWIKLPVEFKGMWYSPEYGGFSVTMKDRFNPEFPPDRLSEQLRKNAKEILDSGKKSKFSKTDLEIASIHIKELDHGYAKPTWITKKKFEKESGKIESIIVYKQIWDSNQDYFPGEEVLMIFTLDYVVTLGEYDGAEGFNKVMRNPPWEHHIKTKL